MEFIELMRTIRRHMALIVVLTVFSAVFSAVILRQMSRIYSSTATLAVQAQDSGLGAAISVFGLPTQVSDMPTVFVTKLVVSDTIAKRVIDKLNLTENENFSRGELTPVQQLKVFHGSTRVESDAMIVKITFFSSDPELAAAVANEIARQVSIFMEEESRHDYKYFQREADAAAKRFEEINEQIREYEEKNGVITLEQQLSTELSLMNQYQNQLLDRRSELKSLNAVLENTTDLALWTRTRQRMEAVKKETNIIMEKISEINREIDRLPEMKRAYAALLREKNNRMLNLNELEKQRDFSFFQTERMDKKVRVLDAAYVDTVPVRPKPGQVIPVGTATGFFLAFFIAISLDSIRREEKE